MKKDKEDRIIPGYYEGPKPNQYEGWTDEDIEKDIARAMDENKKLKGWEDI